MLAGFASGPESTKEDLFARYGGEEFAVVLPETTLEKNDAMAERIRRAPGGAAAPLPVQGGSRSPVTVSVGVAATTGETTLTPNELIDLADEKLFQAKHQGRNRVVAWAGQHKKPTVFIRVVNDLAAAPRSSQT